MATITGFIEKIKFRNEENGYTIMTVIDQSDGDEVGRYSSNVCIWIMVNCFS